MLIHNNINLRYKTNSYKIIYLYILL
uniref:Uncharacterized protein n=1 Tax=Heterorhabditis bacteriophora TaxID=37862 RepID=A0A1I7W7S5_HETBA